MPAIHYYVATSADGFIARADGTYDSFPMKGDHIAAYFEDLAQFDTVLMGRKTYEIGLRVGVANPYPALKTIVFSRTLEASTDPNVELVRTDPVERVRALRAEPGRGVYLCGGGELAGLLLSAGLLDEVTIKVNPLVLGAGIPLFTGAAESKLELISHRVFDSGVVFLRYRVVPRQAAG